MDFTELTKNVFSEKRLQKYGSLNPSSLPETYAHYLWNIQLCEALYPVLNGLEVALRNRTHNELTAQTGYKRWMVPGRNILAKSETDQVQRAINRLSKERKSTGVDQVVASLMLGFWVGLFAPSYERVFWHKNHSLRRVFPDAPKSELGCHSIRIKLNRIRYLRNRVFHHEPIWHWQYLDRTYEDIHRMNTWLSKDWGDLLELVERFRAVRKNSYQPILDKVQAR